MKVNIIVTVLNEESTIELLLKSFLEQTVTPSGVVIVDGGSSDTTWKLLQQWTQKTLPFELVIKQKEGNRSVGRNEAIKEARSEVVAITDAGCVPNKEWLEELLKAYYQEKKKSEERRLGREGWFEEVVVAGSASSSAHSLTPLQAAMVPYVLVMPDRINPETFLPATRSMLLSKSLWKKLGGFDESLSDNEDYAFAKKIEKLKRDKYCSIVYAPNALVEWQPRQTLSQFATMIYRFARGDAYAGIFRPKVGLLFVRYIVAGLLLFYWVKTTAASFLWVLIFSGIFYTMWAVQKNAKYVKPESWLWLGCLQYISDVEVIKGTIVGLVKRYS